MRRVAVLSVVYYEREWQQTVKCLATLGVPTYFADRQGTGSLAKAFNEGMTRCDLGRYEYVWCLTNITFKPEDLSELVRIMDLSPTFGAVTPSFDSDHAFTRQKVGQGLVSVPFVEFTCPLVRGRVLESIPLDEEMPYVGHDIDWGIRTRASGWACGVHHGLKAGHVYIRNNRRPEPVTEERKRLRKLSARSTEIALTAKYGPNWRKGYTV